MVTFDDGAFAGKPFAEFLRSCNLNEELQAIVAYAVAGIPSSQVVYDGADCKWPLPPQWLCVCVCVPCFRVVTASTSSSILCSTGEAPFSVVLPTEVGMTALIRKLAAIGRYSSTPFICPMYGTAELAQAFCRAAAVGGAVYMLCNAPEVVEVGSDAEGPCVHVTTSGGMAVRGRCVVAGPEYALRVSGPPAAGALRAVTARALVITRGTIQEGVSRIALTVAPGTAPINNPHPVFVIQTDASQGACPDGFSVLYLSTLCTLPGAQTTMTPQDADVGPALEAGLAVLRRAVAWLTQPVPAPTPAPVVKPAPAPVATPAPVEAPAPAPEAPTGTGECVCPPPLPPCCLAVSVSSPDEGAEADGEAAAAEGGAGAAAVSEPAALLSAPEVEAAVAEEDVTPPLPPRGQRPYNLWSIYYSQVRGGIPFPCYLPCVIPLFSPLCRHTQSSWVFPDGAFSPFVHLTTPALSQPPELQQSLLPLDVSADVVSGGPSLSCAASFSL